LLGIWIYRLVFGFISLVMTLGLLFCLFWVWLYAGYTTGVEFSPDDFSVRQFDYYRPFPYSIGFWKTISPAGDFDVHIRSLSVLPKRNPTTWHLVKDNRTSIRSRNNQAIILTQYLSTYLSTRSRGNSDKFWIVWSNGHSSKAKRLWPLIQAMAFDNLYLITPEVLNQAILLQDVDDQSFIDTLRTKVADELDLMSEERQVKGLTQQAEQLTGLAVKYRATSGVLVLPPVPLNTPEPAENFGTEEIDFPQQPNAN